MPVRLLAALFVVWLGGCGASNNESPANAPADQSDAADDGQVHYVRGKRALRAGRLHEAESELERALASVDGKGQNQELTREEIHFSLAETAMSRFDYPSARRHFEAAYEIDGRARGPSHPRTLEVLEALAIVLDYVEDYAGAEARFRELMPRVERVRGKQSIELARLEMNLAVNLSFQKRDAEAEPLLRTSIPVLEKNHEDDALAHALNTLGNLLYRKGELTPARETLERALATREQASGPDHPHVATILFNLCGIDLDEGKLALAEKSCGRSLSIRKKSLPETHPFRREINERYAEVERRLGKR